MILIVTAVLWNAKDVKNFFPWEKRAIVIWSFWTVYQLTNLYVQGSDYVFSNRPSDLYVMLLEKLFFLYACIAMMKRDFYGTITCVCVAFLFNILLYSFDSSWIIATGYERFLSMELNGNEIALECVTCISIVPLLFSYRKKYFFIFALIDILCVILVISIASRTAFIAVFPSIIAFCFVLFRYVKGNTFILCLLVVIGIIIAPKLIHNFAQSVLSQRIEERENVTVGHLENESLAKWFGERALYIENGYAMFKEHPIFGVGYTNYAEYFSHRNHIEYMAELSDGGIVGFSLFSFFFWCMLYPAFKIKKYLMKNKNILLVYSLILTLLIFNCGLFTTSLMPFYVFSAMILVMSSNIMKENHSSVCFESNQEINKSVSDRTL